MSYPNDEQLAYNRMKGVSFTERFSLLCKANLDNESYVFAPKRRKSQTGGGDAELVTIQMKTSLLLLLLLCVCAPQTLAQQKMLKPDEYTDRIRTVGGELQITPDNEVEFNGSLLFTFHPYEDEGGRGVFLTPVYSFDGTDVVLFWECGTKIYATGTVQVISVTRKGSAKAWPGHLGTGMFPVITKTRNSLKMFFPPSTGLHGGGSYPETWIWQRGKLTKIKTTRR